ncbi:DMT family transporter [Salipiger marinus]|uniref:EamA-like transporter family protein n=1 Tax=Salipiger marinus TaxID=555512 RepID=A0A1G8N4B1_9RHOB|nr:MULTISPECIES: DMT family transporter [Salipiger]MCD1616633.1 DMT family transporter [Salipiger manganoxidans]MEB3418871.1 DMT family transporter [Salipiger manganoxidans]SDI74945.1 EamA-like transporter family protein [Salipiger marinus]HBT00554.1 EamA/RhaT family transporter [Citreicella sp.]
MTTHPLYGLGLATLGALILTPDVLLMRLSGLDGLSMLAWRGTALGLTFWAIWLLTARRPLALAPLATRAGITVILCQTANAALFALGVSLAPAAVVLLAVATMPVWAAVLARLLHGEATSRATWVAMAAVLAGIALAISGKGDLGIGPVALLGALCGLGVAVTLGLSFVTLRHAPTLPLLPAMGTGALISGLAGLTLAAPGAPTDGAILPILATGLVILPASFFCLSTASRHTAASNVSLLMLLETVLGPLWVWLVLAEAPTPRMLAGGAVVVASLALYLAATRPRRRPLPAAPNIPG